MPHKIHCSLNYHFSSAIELPLFANKIKQGIFGHADVFSPESETPIPVSEKELTDSILEEKRTYTEYKSGGIAHKMPYITARKALVNKLDLLAAYVDTVANGDANIIIVSGFDPTYYGEVVKAGKPGIPSKVKITNGDTSTFMSAECESFGPAHTYGCIITEGQPLPASVAHCDGGLIIIPSNQPYRIFHEINHSRKKTLQGLIPGVNYYFYFYVINNDGVSPLSVAVSRLCS